MARARSYSEHSNSCYWVVGVMEEKNREGSWLAHGRKAVLLTSLGV